MDDAQAYDLELAEALARASLCFVSAWDAPLLSVSIGASTRAKRSIKGLGATSGAFRERLRALAVEVGAKPVDVALVMSFETGGSFSPSKRNPTSNAVGLLQFMPETLRHLGTTTEAAAAMSAIEQLDLVRRYFEPWKGRLGTLSRVYMAVLWPRLVGASEDAVLFAAGSIQYAQNAGLDVDKDGRVQVREAVARVRSMRHAAPRVLLIGDSIAEGLEAPLRRLASADGAELVIATHKRGSMVRAWQTTSQRAVDIAAPSVAFVALGSNDAASGHAPRAEHVRAIVNACATWGADVFWLGPFNGAISDELSGLVWQTGQTYLQGAATLKAAGVSTAADGVHLSPTGYAAVAGELWEAAGGSAIVADADVEDEEPEEPTRKRRNSLAVGAALFALPAILRMGAGK